MFVDCICRPLNEHENPQSNPMLPKNQDHPSTSARPASALSRREFIAASSAALIAGNINAAESAAEQELILAGTKAALEKSLYPALVERAYPGHFTVAADGRSFGAENTWPGLDSWQMAGAYLLVGKHREVLDYFDFVQASQRKDGNIPFAIYPGEQSPRNLDSFQRGMRFPEDVYSYQPAIRAGQPNHSNLNSRKWIGLFRHWQMKANPLSVLGAVSYILTAAEIFAATQSESWLREKVFGIEAAGNYLLSRISPNGLLGGAGFYVESPPRNQWDGVTQCYGVFAFEKLAALRRAFGERFTAPDWGEHAAKLSARFQESFWQQNHFAEYVHPERGVVDSHGLSDVNWAAIGLHLATDRQTKILWPILTSEQAFWRGDLPTHLVTKPDTYENWELAEPLPFAYTSFTKDVAAMGRVWYLETLACLRMKDYRRLRESVLKVCAMGKKHDWSWYERYHAAENNTVKPAGVFGYCEYPAILVRAVLGHPDIFPEARMLRA